MKYTEARALMESAGTEFKQTDRYVGHRVYLEAGKLLLQFENGDTCTLDLSQSKMTSEDDTWECLAPGEFKLAELTFNCPRRVQDHRCDKPGLLNDYWSSRYDKDGYLCCSYDGSLHPDKFMELIEAGTSIGVTDKNYKAYIGNHKFYYQHLSEEQKKKFVELYNAGKLVVPGGFYVLPFFCKVL